MDKRKDLIELLQGDYLSDEKVALLHTLANMGPSLSKKEVLEMSGKNVEEMHFDNAYDHVAYVALRDHYPDAINGMYITDYTEHAVFGRLTNIYNIFAKHIFKVFQS